MSDRPDRRDFLQTATGGALVAVGGCVQSGIAAERNRRPLAEVVGITTGGLNYQLENRLLTVFTLPNFMRDDLGMRLIDLNTHWLEAYDESYIERVRGTAEDAGCYFTNLKVNHKFGDLYSKDADERRTAMANARQLIKAAQTLGARWIRFQVPKLGPNDDGAALFAYRELAAFAKHRDVQLLVENGGWLQSDPDSIVRVVNAIAHNVAACPDTGNWNDDIRYEALAKSFPGAASCDFKVFDLDVNNHHAKYDIRRCFDIGWQAGFRGPWAIEHWNEDTAAFARETVYLRDQLVQWMSAAG